MLDHTPGPWLAQRDSVVVSGGHIIPFMHISAGDKDICYLSLNPDEVIGNATIMAAGWDMLQALKALVKWYGNRTGVGDELSPVDEQEAEVAAAMRAIAKAEGRT